MNNASLRDFNKGEGTYVADTLERQEIFLNMKRYLGIVRFSTFVPLLAFTP